MCPESFLDSVVIFESVCMHGAIVYRVTNIANCVFKLQFSALN